MAIKTPEEAIAQLENELKQVFADEAKSFPADVYHKLSQGIVQGLTDFIQSRYDDLNAKIASSSNSK